MPTAKNYGQVAVAPQMALQPSSSSRVTVNTVIKKRPALSAQSSSSSSSATSPTTLQKPLMITSSSNSSNPPTSTLMTVSESPPIAKSPTTNKSIKKDPMAALFVPKRKAYSQRPV